MSWIRGVGNIQMWDIVKIFHRCYFPPCHTHHGIKARNHLWLTAAIFYSPSFHRNSQPTQMLHAGEMTFAWLMRFLSLGFAQFTLHHVTVLHNHVTILHNHVTILHNHVTILHNHVTILHNHIRILHNHVTISHKYLNVDINQIASDSAGFNVPTIQASHTRTACLRPTRDRNILWHSHDKKA